MSLPDRGIYSAPTRDTPCVHPQAPKAPKAPQAPKAPEAPRALRGVIVDDQGKSRYALRGTDDFGGRLRWVERVDDAGEGDSKRDPRVIELRKRLRTGDAAGEGSAHVMVIVEDDVNRRYVTDPPPPISSLAPERSFFVAGTSKAIAGGLRAGARVGRLRTAPGSSRVASGSSL